MFLMKKQKPMFKKLFSIFSCFALIPVILTGVLSFYISNWIFRRDLQRNIEDSLTQTGFLVDGKLEEMKYISENFTSNAYLKQLLRLPMTDSNIMLLEAELGKTNAVNLDKGYDITLCGTNGQIYTNWSTDGMIYRNSLVQQIKSTSWFSKMEQSRSVPVWISCMDNIAGYDKTSKVVAMARNIMNDRIEEQDVLGFMVVSMVSQRMSEALKGGMERTYVIDKDKTIVLSQNEKEIGTFLDEIIIGQTGLQMVEIDGTYYTGGMRANKFGEFYTVILVPAAGLNWQFVISVITIGATILLSIGFVFMAAYYFSKSLSKPIQTLEHSMQQVQYGTLEKGQIATTITEIACLADNYNSMVERIEGLIEEKIAQEQKDREIQIEKANAELKFLRAQIMPHFLFNTLNSIKWLAVIHGATPVEEMIAALGRLLECSMQKGRDFITVKEEIENIKAYLKIQEMRYGNRLKTTYHIEDEIQSAIIPKLILQPLVENAIIHGVDKNAEGGLISIRIHGEVDTIIVEIEDDGPGIVENVIFGWEESPQERDRHLSGIGIGNVNKRIQMIYGETCGLHYKQGKENKGTIAILVLKKEEQHAEDTVG